MIVRGRDVLLVRRGSEPLRGRWSVPGGKVLWGERLQDAVVRETREETAVTVAPRDVLLVLELIEGAEAPGGHHFVVVDYRCDYVAGEVHAGSDAEAAAWVARDDLGGYDLTESMLAVVTEAFRRTPHEESP